MQTKRTTGGKSHKFATNVISPTTMLCWGASVRLECQNFMPEWGLHQNAHDKVVEMTLNDGKDPNTGHQPRCVTVNFLGCTGPK